MAFTSITRSHSSTVVSSSTPRDTTPALLTTTSSLPKRATPPRHRLGPRVLAGHVQPHEHAFAASLVDLCLHLPAVFLQHVADDDLGTLTGEQPRFLGTHAAGAAADDGNLSLPVS